MQHTLPPADATLDAHARLLRGRPRLRDADAVAHEADDVGVLLQHPVAALVQLDRVPIVRLGRRRVEADDLLMRDLHDRHALVVAQRLDAVQVLTPDLIGGNVALAKVRRLDRLPRVASACLGPYQTFEPVEAIHDQRLSVVLFGIESANCLDHIGVSLDDPRRRVEHSKPVLDCGDDGVRPANGKRRLADAVRAVEDHDRRFRLGLAA